MLLHRGLAGLDVPSQRGRRLAVTMTCSTWILTSHKALLQPVHGGEIGHLLSLFDAKKIYGDDLTVTLHTLLSSY